MNKNGKNATNWMRIAHISFETIYFYRYFILTRIGIILNRFSILPTSVPPAIGTEERFGEDEATIL